MNRGSSGNMDGAISTQRIMWIGQGKLTMAGDFRFFKQIYNRIGILSGFYLGTQHTFISKPKFGNLANEIPIVLMILLF
jgi:hypothetical protein